MFDNIKNFFNNKTKSFTALIGLGDFTHKFLWRKREGLEWYEKSLYVNRAINKRAEKVGQIKFVLKKGEEEIENEWTELLRRPNENQSGDQFWRLAQKYYDTIGAAFILKRQTPLGRKVDELELLRADLVDVVMNKEQNRIIRFDYHREGQVIKYEPDEIIYIYNPDPRNPLLGESLIASAIRAIGSEVQISQYHANVIRNGGKVETIFKIKNAQNSQQVKDLKAQYLEEYSEAKQSGKPLFAGGDIEAVSTALTPQELSFLETKEATLKDISIATGVPIEVLGVTSSATFANADASIKIFLRETIKPLLDNLVDALNWKLIPDEFELTYIDPTPEDKEEKRKDLETANNIYAMTINEKREALGLDKVPNGNDILIPFNLTRLGGEVEETKKKSFHPLQNYRVRRMYAKQKDALQTKFERRMLSATKKFFADQKERLIDKVQETKKKSTFDRIYSQSLEVSLAQTALVPVIRGIFQENGQDTAQTFGLDFNMNSAAERSIQERSELFSNSIINTTREQLQNQFSESITAGETREQLVSRIENLYGDITTGRAEVIARTEVHAAMQKSNLEVYKQAGLTIKIWVTVGDERVRDEHAAMDGEEVPLNGVFSNGLSEPSEPNCRCSI